MKSFIYSNVFTVKKKMKTIWVNVTRQLRSTHANQPSVKDILPKQNSCNDAVMTLLCSKLGSNYKKMQKIFR